VALTAEAYGLTDVGRKRQHNEDAFAVDSELGLFVVADGMGGHAAGEVASQRAVEVVREQLAAGRQVLEELGQANNAEARAAAAALVETAIQRACAEVYRLAASDSTKRGMGTTFVCLVMAGTKGIVGHVGDSRVYLVRGGQAHRLTEDHTLIAAQVKAGTLTREQAQASQFRNVITRAVGIQESVQVDTLMVDLLPKDLFVLCSDGLHGYLADDELAPLTHSTELEGLPKKLVGLANDRGGKDNVTVVVVGISDAGAAPEELEETTSRMEVLKSIPIFRHLTYKEQTAILSIASTKAFPAESEILTEGQSGDELYIVVKGRVRVETGGVGVAELRTGGHFGEMGLVDHAPRSATVRALEPTRAMVIARSELMQLMKREPILAVKLLWSFVQVLSDRLRATNNELSEVRQELAAAQAVQPFAEE
jgi:PPM family protein phosphatase